MKNSLLKKAKLDDYVNAMRPLMSELDDQSALSELESLREVGVILKFRLSFEKIIDTILIVSSTKDTLFQKVISIG